MEKPAVWGPNLKSPPKCVNCLARWQGVTCAECQFPVCSDTCARGEVHLQECGVLSRLDIDITFTVGKFQTSYQQKVTRGKAVSGRAELLASAFKWQCCNSYQLIQLKGNQPTQP